MFNTFSLKKISIILFVVLTLTAVLVGSGVVHLTRHVIDLNDAWLSFKSQHAEKPRLLTSLRATLGYGGMIHDFKNYVLRKDFKRLANLQKSMGAAQAIVTQYSALSTTQAERLVLEDISDMLRNYHANLLLVRNEITNGKTSVQIDKLVKIDDQFALRGMNVLHAEIIARYPYYADQKQKPILASAIRSGLGYGGMIHSFKNFVLRNDKKYFDKTVISIEKTENIIKSYYQLNPTLGETTALQDIEKTLESYKEKMELAAISVKKGLSPESIDKLVRIDDKHALRGLTTLEQDIILQIDAKSSQMSQKLHEIIVTERIFAYVLITSILLIAVFIFWLFSKKIISPVQEFSVAMSALASGYTDIEYSYPSEAKTELGEMARALKIFQSNEYKRKQAEEEIRRLAMTDPLTGLANRNRFEKRYKEMASLAKREGRTLALLALDLDKFKPINDEYGHAVGDEVLMRVAESLQIAFRETDLLARLGGDEFVVVLYGPDNIDSVTHSAERVINLVSRPIVAGEHIVEIGVSVGISFYTSGNIDMSLMMQHADKALYQAKDAGRNTYRVYNAEETRKNISLLHPAKED